MVPGPLRSFQEGGEVASLKLPRGFHSGELEKRWNEVDSTDGRGADLARSDGSRHGNDEGNADVCRIWGQLLQEAVLSPGVSLV